MSIADRVLSRNMASPSAASDIGNTLVGAAVVVAGAVIGIPGSFEVGKEFFTEDAGDRVGLERYDTQGKSDIIFMESALLLGTALCLVYGVARAKRGAQYALRRMGGNH